MPKPVLYLLAVFILLPGRVFAEVDQRPLEVKVVPAFPQLKWPGWLIGEDTGRPRDARPLLIMGAGDGKNRIFAGSEYGTVHVWPNKSDASEMKTFLDVRDRVQYDDKQNEEGFLGLAFHPKFKEN